jgi:uncharacterized protein
VLITLLQELAGPSPGKAGGLAAMTAGAIGAALFAKCRYSPAIQEMEVLKELALADGGGFENYLRAKRAGEEVTPWLIQATESPLKAAEVSLQLLDRLPLARKACPKCMLADLAVGADLLESSVRGNLKLVAANLRLFPSGWSEGMGRVNAVSSWLVERDLYRRLFEMVETVVVVGISDDIEKPACYVPTYFKEKGYRILGVHPRGYSEVAERTTTQLRDLGSSPDLVLIFRRSDKVPEHLDDLLSVLPKAVWMQQGIHHEAVASALRASGVTVVSDRCAMLEHQKL